MRKKPSHLWYDESGITDDWLRENDPLYKPPKNRDDSEEELPEDRDYLTARQYRTRAREKEIPAGKTAAGGPLKKYSYRELVDIEDTEQQIRKSEELVLDLE